MRALVAAAVLLGGCAYYNGMYNAERLAGSAERAERDQRRLEANGLWGQVATKTDSVLARHPDSKWADDAWLLRGIALERLGQCENAVRSLLMAQGAVADRELIEKADLSLGRCQLALGRVDAAEAAFARVVDSRDPDRRREARLARGRALRASGRHAEAVELLTGMPGRPAAAERAASLAALGRTDEAVTIADSLVATGDTSLPWPAIVDAIGRSDPRAASQLVDRVSAMGDGSPERRARWLVSDARRLAAVDTAAARARLAAAAELDSTGAAGGEARLELIRRDLAAVEAPAELAGPADRLRELAASPSPSAPQAAQLGGLAERIRVVADSVPPGSPEGDMQLFLAAELARDSLGAPQLAVGLFRRVASEWPASPYVPKALLAWRHLEPDNAEAERLLLDSTYADSPYLARVRGEDPLGYRALEDSLGAFAITQASTFAPAAAPGRPGVGRDTTGAGLVGPGDDGPRRGRVRPRGSRTPEP